MQAGRQADQEITVRVRRSRVKVKRRGGGGASPPPPLEARQGPHPPLARGYPRHGQAVGHGERTPRP